MAGRGRGVHMVQKGPGAQGELRGWLTHRRTYLPGLGALQDGREAERPRWREGQMPRARSLASCMFPISLHNPERPGLREPISQMRKQRLAQGHPARWAALGF